MTATISEDGKSSAYTYGEFLDPSLSEQVDRAIELMKNEPEPEKAAGKLLVMWHQQGHITQAMIGDLIGDYLLARVKARARVAKVATKVAAK